MPNPGSPVRRLPAISAAVLALCHIGVPGQARAACSLGAVAVVPLQPAEGHMTFDATINGQSAKFLLDTGAFATMLVPSAAERLGMNPSQLNMEAMGFGGTQHVFHARAKQMRFGGLNADGMDLGVADMWKSGWTGADGLFGMNMMAAYDIDLDFIGGHFILFEADGDCRKPAVALTPPLYLAKLEPISHNREIDVVIDIEGTKVRAQLDTGAPRTVLFKSTAIRLGVSLAPLHAPGHAVSHGIGPLPVGAMTHVFKTVTIGDLQFNNMPVEIVDYNNPNLGRAEIGSLIPGGDDEAEGQAQMLLGADFAQKVHVWISNSSHKMILQYPPSPSALPH
jgi:predicted aspartyl protease